MVRVQLRDAAAPETGQRYTIKCCKREEENDGDSERHEKITLEPVNPEVEPVGLNSGDRDELRGIVDLIEWLEA